MLLTLLHALKSGGQKLNKTANKLQVHILNFYNLGTLHSLTLIIIYLYCILEGAVLHYVLQEDLYHRSI